jgi:uroporphyrinogen III methyltransferase/synthase
VCAIGPATARAIEEAGALAGLVASDSKAEGVLTAIVQYLGGEANIRGLRFLIPRARVARETLPGGLRALGAHVESVETYQTIKPDVDRETVIGLFKENSIDVITFTSSSTVSNFAELAGLTDLSELLETTLVACIGPTTAETAARHGLARVVQPELYNTAALVDSIVASIGEK